MRTPTLWLISIAIFVVVVVSAVRITDDDPGLAAPTTTPTTATEAVESSADTTTIPLEAPTSTTPPATLAPGTSVCDRYESVVVTGTVASPDLVEASGLAVSRTAPDVLWSHNDSRDRARLYAMDRTGADLGAFDLPGAFAFDWEDLAAGPGPDGTGSYLYVGDIGDNFDIRDGQITVYRVPDTDPGSIDGSFEEVVPIPYRYPDGTSHNAEAMFVDPVEPAIYFVTKGTSEAFIYKGSLAPSGDENNLEQVGALFLDAEVSGGDISWDGSVIALRGYTTVWMWSRDSGTTVADAFASEPCIAPSPEEEQGESIAFEREFAYWTVSEGTNKPIHTVPTVP